MAVGFLHRSVPCFLRQGLTLSLWLTDLAGLNGQRAPGILFSLPPCASIPVCAQLFFPYHGLGSSELRFSGCQAAAFPLGLLPALEEAVTSTSVACFS